MHQSYQERLKHKEDFKVRYKFRTEDEGGRRTLPYQGIRFDFWYEFPKHELDGIFMIWPEFEDENGELIQDGEVSKEGIARMWIVRWELRKYHQSRIKIGTKGYFMEGTRRIADCEIVEIVDLMINKSDESN